MPATASFLLATAVGLSVSITPHVCSEPCRIDITMRSAEPVEGERICVALESGDWYREACWFSSGATVTQTSIGNIPAGEYDVIALVGKRTVRTQLIVVGK